MKDRLADAMYGLGWGLTRWVPHGMAQAAFTQLGDEVWRRHGRSVLRLQANLRRARPGATEAEIDELSRQAMRSYMRYWCEAFRLPVWSRDDVLERVVVHNEESLREAYATGRGVILPLPHMANWDLAGAWACHTGMPFTTVVERLKPERLFRRFVDYRERLGFDVIPLNGEDQPALGRLLERARAGGLICLVADRDLSAGGVEVELLGQRALLPAGPALIARATGATLMPVTLEYVGRRVEATIHPPVEPEPGKGGLRAMTQQVADVFSAGIRQAPQDWHMLQRVFVEDLGDER